MATERKVIAQHWTRDGVAQIEQEFRGGIWWFRLRFAGIDLQEYLSPDRAAEALVSGERDAELPFKASRLGIPQDWRKWNGLR